MHAHLDHRLGRALRHERIAPEVAEAAAAPDAPQRVEEPRRAAGSLDVGDGAVEQVRLPDRVDSRDAGPTHRPRPPAVRDDRPGPPATARVPSLAERGGGEHSDLDLPVALAREERAEQGDAAHEVVRAVDRVHVPADGRAGLVRLLLLADDPVRGIRVRDALADEPLDGTIRLRHERSVRLPRHLELGPEVAERDRIGLRSHLQCEGQPAVELGLRAAELRRAPRRTVGRLRVGSPWNRRPGAGPPRRRSHPRTRAFDGSHRGSRTTSAPTQVPNTSISPFVPIAARSEGRYAYAIDRPTA